MIDGVVNEAYLAAFREAEWAQQRIYSASQLVAKLEAHRGKPVTMASLKNWRGWLNIEACPQRLYTRYQFEYLAALCRALAEGYTIGQFVSTLNYQAEQRKSGRLS